MFHKHRSAFVYCEFFVRVTLAQLGIPNFHGLAASSATSFACARALVRSNPRA